MKRLFFGLIFLSIAFFTYGQTEKGKFLVGGSISYNNTLSSSQRSGQMALNPSFGYFIKNNLAIGTDLSFTHQRTVNKNVDNNWSTYHLGNGIGLLPFIRYYKFIGDKLAIFGQAGIGLTYIDNQYTNQNTYPSQGSYQYKENTIIGAIMLKPGLAYFLSKKFALELTAGSISNAYSYIYYKNSSGNGSNNFTFNLGLRSLTLGGYFYL